MGSLAEPGAALQRLEVASAGGDLQLVTGAGAPVTPARGVVVKTHYAGMCHTDVHVWRDRVRLADDLVVGLAAFIPGFSYPIVMGHELSGEVWSLGAEYSGPLAVGDRVVVYPWLGCSTCDACTHGRTNVCAATIASSVGVGGREGGYQSLVALPGGDCVVRVPAGVDMAVASLFGCSALTAYNAVMRVRDAVTAAVNTTGRSSLLVVGAGGLGLWAISWARALLPPGTHVYCADVTQDKTSLAQQHGAHDTVLWPLGGDETEEALLERSRGVMRGGADAVIDLVGRPNTVGRAVALANKGCTVAVVGLAGGAASLSIFALVANQVTVSGVYTGTRAEMTAMMEAFATHEVSPPPLHVVTPEQASTTLRDLEAGKVAGRAVIRFTEDDNIPEIVTTTSL